MPTTLIGSIRCTPQQPRPGESVRVEVLDVNGNPLDASGVRVTIGGQLGGVQHLQFAKEGHRRLTVVAEAGGLSERQTVALIVTGESLVFVPVPGKRAELALIQARQSLSSPYEVELSVGAAAVGMTPDDTGPMLSNGGPRYEWDFGDGTPVAVTTTPVVRHDFFASIDHVVHGTGRFPVRCKIVHAGLEVTRTLTVHSAYHLCRQRGTVVPHVKSDVFAHKLFKLFTAGFTVFNVEGSALVLDRMAIAPMPTDPDALAVPPAFTALKTPVTVAPNSSTQVGVHTPIGGQIPANATGVVVWYAGHVGDRPVRLSLTFPD